jgi:hypothetical protein
MRDAKCIIRVMRLTHTQIIDLWPSVGEFAEEMGVNHRTARSWKQRISIPSHYWARLISCALVKGFNSVTPDALTCSAAERRAA